MSNYTEEVDWLPDESSIVSEVTLHETRPAFEEMARATTAPTVSRRGTYRILITNETDPYDDPVTPDEVVFGFEALARRGDAYSGKSRKAAKTSIADAELENFDDLRALTESLVSEDRMIALEPPITTEPESDRRDVENRNVRLPAVLLAASREDDNDFHLIIGTDPRRGRLVCMNVEISGLPARSSASFDQLKRARDAYKAFFSSILPGASYQFYPTPIPIEIEGSLFFDVNHVTGGRPGPQKLRRFIPTVWEIHPITDIVFEP